MQILGNITDRPKITIISGYYNRSHVVERTVTSLMEQTEKDFQAIIFDDGSPDDTWETMKKLHARYNDPRLIFVLYEENKGFVNGLIDTIGRISTPYIAIQGSGDYSYPERMALQRAALDADEGLGAVGCWYELVSEDQSRRRLLKPQAENATLKSLQKIGIFGHGEVMFRRTAYDSAGGYRRAFKMAMDRDLWLRMRPVARYYTVPQILYRKFALRDGVSYEPKKMVAQARYKALGIRLSQMGGEEGRKLYELAEKEGVEAAIPISDSIVQHYVNWGVMRLIGHGYWDPKTDLRPLIISPLRRNFLQLGASTLNRPGMAWVRRLAERMFDMSEPTPERAKKAATNATGSTADA